ncbi:uncharacterized protein TNCV_4006911 [Trichonephila clavipes]|nr:uncharacterized protein TNCV_4006911 [Trichonephila clavipes]
MFSDWFACVGDTRLHHLDFRNAEVLVLEKYVYDYFPFGGQRTHIFGGDQGYTPEIRDEILTTARDLELEVNEDDIEELIMGHEDELTTEELQEILNEEHQKIQRNVSPSEQEEDERGPIPTSAFKDLLKKWADVRAMVLKWHPNQADVSRVGDLYNNNAINYFWKLLKTREKQSTLDMFFNAP